MKKFIAMLLALAMVLSLAACGSKTDAPAETKAQTAAEKPAATEKVEESAPAAEPVTLTWGSWVFAEDSVRPIYQEMADLYNETNEYNTTIAIFLRFSPMFFRTMHTTRLSVLTLVGWLKRLREPVQ